MSISITLLTDNSKVLYKFKDITRPVMKIDGSAFFKNLGCCKIDDLGS